MSTCRSSAGCRRPAGHGRFGTFCAEHAAALAELRSAHFTPEGTALARPLPTAEQRPSVEEDALRIATEVLRIGKVGRNILQNEIGFTYARFRRAVELAGRCEWIVAGRALSPGPVPPPLPAAAPTASWVGAAPVAVVAELAQQSY